jgi:tetratricopeptide (TPR) repeat protein
MFNFKPLVVLLVVSALLISTEVKSTVSVQKDSIQLFIRQFKYSEALILLDRVLLAEPTNKEAYASKGLVLQELYSYDQAIKAYVKALALDSTDQRLLIALANTYKLSQDYPNAVRYYTSALAHDSTSQFLQLELATCKLMNDQFDDAIADFSALYQKDSLNTYILKSLGYSFNQIEQYEGSIYFFQKALAVKPNDKGCVMSLANLYSKVKLYGEGIQVTEAYRMLDSTNREVNSKNAYLFLLDKNFTGAIARFRKCIEAGDQSEFNYKNLGIAYYSMDEYETAKEYLEKAFGLDPEDASTLHFLGICCYKSFYKELGIRYLEEALKVYQPTEDKIALVYRNYAEACRGWDKCPTEKKIASSLRAYEFNPKDSTLAQILGLEYERAKDWPKAVTYYELYVNSLKFDEKDPDQLLLKRRYEQELEQLKKKLTKK